MFCNVGLSDVKSEECLAIEDICVGDSALDYFTEKELKDTQHFIIKIKNLLPAVLILIQLLKLTKVLRLIMNLVTKNILFFTWLAILIPI